MTKTKIILSFIALYSFLTLSMMSCTKPKITTSQEGTELNPLRVVYVHNPDGGDDKVIGDITSLGPCIAYTTIRKKQKVTFLVCPGYSISIY